jgi:hypothetical protein
MDKQVPGPSSETVFPMPSVQNANGEQYAEAREEGRERERVCVCVLFAVR